MSMTQYNPFFKWWEEYYQLRDNIKEIKQRNEEYEHVSVCKDILSLTDELKDLIQERELESEKGNQFFNYFKSLGKDAFDAIVEYYEKGKEDFAQKVCDEFLEVQKLVDQLKSEYKEEDKTDYSTKKLSEKINDILKSLET